MNRIARACVTLALLAAPSVSAAAPTPPPWDDMLHDAKGVFERHRSDDVLKKMVRSGEPKISSRRTAVQLVPTVFQDVECIYQTKKFGTVERQVLTLHYESSSLGGWAFVGYGWGDPETMREGKYPPRPAPPSEREIFDAVRAGMADWKVRPEHVEKVTPAGKPTFAWLDDVPTAGYLYRAKVYVRDVVDRTALYGARYKTRFVCDLKVQLALEDSVTWTMQGTVPDCADEGCALARQCKDTWGNGAPPKGGTPLVVEKEPPPRRIESDRHAARRREPVEERPTRDLPPPPPPRTAPPPVQAAHVPPAPVKTGKLASSGQCPPWQFATAATSGHCCWREQVWSDANRSCIGIPKCPPGFKAQGTDCLGK